MRRPAAGPLSTIPGGGVFNGPVKRDDLIRHPVTLPRHRRDLVMAQGRADQQRLRPARHGLRTGDDLPAHAQPMHARIRVNKPDNLDALSAVVASRCSACVPTPQRMKRDAESPPGARMRSMDLPLTDQDWPLRTREQPHASLWGHGLIASEATPAARLNTAHTDGSHDRADTPRLMPEFYVLESRCWTRRSSANPQ